MEREGSLAERICAWIRHEKTDGKRAKRIYEIVEGPHELRIVETQKDGEADVRCEVPAGCTCVVFHLHGQDGLFEFLLRSSNADGTFLFARADGTVGAWIVECKWTISASSWEHARRQFRWTLARLLAVAGVIGVEIQSVSLTTAFREDQLSPEGSPNPAVYKVPLGEVEPSEDGEVPRNPAARARLAWLSGRVPLTGYRGEFAHTKLQLDAGGNGACPFGG